MKLNVVRSVLLLFFVLLSCFIKSNAQPCFSGGCNLQPQITPSNLVCAGTPVTLTANASTLAIDADFNDLSFGFGFSTTVPVQYSVPCASPSLDGTPFLWFGNTSPANQRFLETIDFNLSAGGFISFDLKFGVQSDPAPCEGPDLANEGVSLQYSTDGGINWIDIIYFSPSGQLLPSNPGTTGSVVGAGQQTNFTQWANYVFDIPPGAQQECVRLRWIQTNATASSTNEWDHWGLDNIKVGAISDPGETEVVWLTHPDIDATQPFNFIAQESDVFIVRFTTATDTCFDTLHLTVDPLPIADLDIPFDVCLGSPTLFDASGSQPQGNIQNYRIYPNSNFSVNPITSTNDTIFFTAPVASNPTFTATLIVTTPAGCRDTATAEYRVLNRPRLATLTGTPELCLGDSAFFNATLQPNSVQTGFSWDFTGNGDFELTEASLAESFLFDEPGLYTVKLLANNQNVCFDSLFTQVIVRDLPQVGTDGESVCLGTLSELFATIFYNDTISITENVTWTITQTGETFEGDTELSLNFAEPGSYTILVEVTSDFGCSSTDTLEYLVFNNPEASFTVQQECFRVVNFFLETDDQLSSIAWDFGDGQSSTLENPTHTYASGGTYIITLSFEDQNGCINEYTAPIEVDNTLALDEIVIPNIITPNGDGVNDVFKLDDDFVKCNDYKIEIYNRWGKRVFVADSMSNTFFEGKTQSGAELADGVYMFIITFEGENEPITGSLTIAR